MECVDRVNKGNIILGKVNILKIFVRIVLKIRGQLVIIIELKVDAIVVKAIIFLIILVVCVLLLVKFLRVFGCFF
jgi:hypothetical protein